MVFLLGTDEAGYGPNLGPLCIAATAWQVPDDAAGDCLYQRLTKAVCQAPDADDPRLAIADSKCLYKSGGTLELLERGVLSALSCLDRLPKCWRDLWLAIDDEALASVDTYPWHAGYDEPLPHCTEQAILESTAAQLLATCQSAQARLLDLQASVVFPAEFNAAVKKCGNKAEVLSLATLRLARRIVERLPDGKAVVLCDKHGGRNYYAALLQHIFPDELVLVRQETSALGSYEVRHQGRPIEFRFQPQGEKHLPTALASMTAKYLRELAMRPFNVFWQQHVTDLRPTAGYYTDAVRFYADIRPATRRLKIAPRLIWRVK